LNLEEINLQIKSSSEKFRLLHYLLFGNRAAYTTVVRLILHTKRTEKVYPYFTFLHVS
jgi:hypothetical protein